MSSTKILSVMLLLLTLVLGFSPITADNSSVENSNIVNGNLVNSGVKDSDLVNVNLENENVQDTYKPGETINSTQENSSAIHQFGEFKSN